MSNDRRTSIKKTTPFKSDQGFIHLDVPSIAVHEAVALDLSIQVIDGIHVLGTHRPQ